MTVSKKKILKRATKWMVASMSILIAILLLFLYFFGQGILSRNLAYFVKQKTDGQYSISFSNLSLNPFTRSISFDDFQLKPTQISENDFTFSFSTEAFHIDKIAIIDLLRDKKLSINKISIQKPQIRVSDNTNLQNDQKSIHELVSRLRPFINHYFTSISIKEIEIVDAGLLRKKTSRQLLSPKKPISFHIGIKQFFTDSVILSGDDDYFEASDVFLKIENYRKLLGDSIHQVSVNELIYSIKNNGIQAYDIALMPIDSSRSEITKYRVDVPELRIQSKSIEDIFQNDTILIDTLELKKARIKVIPPENAPGINLRRLKEFDLFQLVKNDFSQLKIGHLKLQADLLSIERKEDNTLQNLEKLKVTLDSFQLDSASYTDLKKILYSDQLDIRIEQYNIKLNDQIHQFSAANISACSKSNALGADKLRMWANERISGDQTIVSMNCDSIRMRNIDLAKLFHFRIMPLQEIAVYKPELKINKDTIVNVRAHKSNSLLYNFIGNYIKGVYSNLVTIEQGKFTITDYESKQDSGIIATEFNFRLTDFSLDSISANKTDKLFFATNFDLEFMNYNMKFQDQLHALQIEKIEVSSLQKKATLKNLHLFAKEQGDRLSLLKKYNKSGVFDIKIPYLYLRNTNIHHAFFNKKLNINNFSVIDPNIHYELIARQDHAKNEFSPRDFYDLLKDYISDIYIGKIHVVNGEFKLINENKKGKTISFDNKFNLELEGFRLNEAELSKEKLLFSDHFELILKDYLFKLSDKVHYLQANEIGFSTKRSEVFVKNAVLYPDITSPFYQQMPRHLQVSTPEIKLSGVDIKKAYFSKKLFVDQLSIKRPDIKIYRTGSPGKRLNLKEFNIPLPEELDILSLMNLKLDDGHISIINANQKQHREIASLNIQFSAQEVSLTNTKNNESAEFNAENISTNIENLEFTPDIGRFKYSLSSLNYAKINKQIQMKGLHISPKDHLKNEGFIRAVIPFLKLDGLNSSDTSQDNYIHAKNILATGAILSFASPAKENNFPSLYNLKLNKDLLSITDELSSENIELRNTTVQFEDRKKKYHLSNINLMLSDFRLDKYPADKLLGADRFEISIKEFQHTDKNKLYDLLFKEIRFSSHPSKLSIHDIEIKPQYSKDDYQKMISFQTDYYQGRIGLIEARNFDIRRYLEKKQLAGKQIILKNISLDIFRDMRTKFNENQRPPLPQQIIRDFDTPFYFDSVRIVSSNINYAEQLENMPEPGKIRFHQVNACIYPLTNMNHMLNQHSTSLVHAEALLMNKAKIEVDMQYDMLSPNDKFHVNGSIAPFQMDVLNPMTRNAAQISIRSGQVNRFEFDFDADNLSANGKLKFAYDDLKINILSMKDGDTKESKFASFLANSLMIKSKNPRTRILLPDVIHFDRDPKRSILNYWWKSIFSGTKNTFGIKESK